MGFTLDIIIFYTLYGKIHVCNEFFRIENMTMAAPQINSKDNYERYKADP